MSEQVDLYKTQYDHDREEVYEQIRGDTYGEDVGQSSWITSDEALGFIEWLNIGGHSKVLEVACGVGGISCLMATEVAAIVHGIDIAEEAVRAAKDRAEVLGLTDRVEFSVEDASKTLKFSEGGFDAIFCNDSINHLAGRDQVLADWYRILASGGRVLFTDPILVTGILTDDEIRVRSSIGFYLFTPQGENERLLKAAGFRILRVEDVTDQVAKIAQRWHEARERRKPDLLNYEDEEQYAGLQELLSVSHRLAAEGRLSRHAYLAEKNG